MKDIEGVMQTLTRVEQRLRCYPRHQVALNTKEMEVLQYLTSGYVGGTSRTRYAPERVQAWLDEAHTEIAERIAQKLTHMH